MNLDWHVLAVCRDVLFEKLASQTALDLRQTSSLQSESTHTSGQTAAGVSILQAEGKSMIYNVTDAKDIFVPSDCETGGDRLQHQTQQKENTLAPPVGPE